MMLYPQKAKKEPNLFKSQTKNLQSNDLQKNPDFDNLALKKPIWQPCDRLRLTPTHDMLAAPPLHSRPQVYDKLT